MSFPIALLQDDFQASTPAAAWTALITGSATMSQGSGLLNINLPSSVAGAHLGQYRSNATYDLTGDDFSWNINTMVSTSVAAAAYFQLLNGLDGQNQVFWRQVSNAITARYIQNGAEAQLYTATWSATTYKYLRISESGGTITFWSSTNGTSWTSRATLANPFAITALYVQFAASCGNVASPGSLKLNDVNLILPAPSSTWRFTTADWSITNRLRPVTLAATANAQGAIVTADTMDSAGVLGGTLHYYAGPLGSSSGGYLQLTEYASLALAETSAFQIPVNGRVDLPAMVDARYMRLYHRSTDASAHTIYEYVPRRIVQADDIEAESIRAINISAGAITADKIFVLNLAAISASIGQLSIDTTGWIYQGTGTGAAPTTGLKLFNSGGIGKLSGYNAGTEQITIDTDGKLKSGAGAVILDASGVAINAASSGAAADLNSIRFLVAGTVSGKAYGYYSAGASNVGLRSDAPGSRDAILELVSYGPSTKNGQILMSAFGNNAASEVDVTLDATANTFIVVAGTTKLTGGLNIGTATGAGAGQISTSGSVGLGGATQGNIRLYVKGQDATSSNYAFLVQNSAGTQLAAFRDDGAVSLGVSGATQGFYGSGGGTRPTVTGSRGSNAALASLLTALAGLNLLVDSST